MDGIPDKIEAPCGNIAYFDNSSTSCAYRCLSCFAVIGSMGMPRECAQLARAKSEASRKKGE
jgi:hypothetical protein